MRETLYQFFSESNIIAMSTVCLLYVLLLLILMSIRLKKKHSSIAYIILLAGLILMLIDSSIAALYMTKSKPAVIMFGYVRALFVTLSFILINLALLRMYKRMNTSMRNRFTLLIVSVPVVIILSYLFISPQDSNKLAWMLTIWQGIIIGLCYIWVSPRIKQQSRYLFSLAAYAGILITTAINVIQYDGMNQSLLITKQLFSLVYYSILFFLVFERIIEQLQFTYRSSITDGLTGLYNRKYMFTSMSQMVRRRNRSAIIFCDIDNFKKLNDTQGHLIADEVLKKAASIIQEEVEDIGLAGRFGGEELIAFIYHPKAKPDVIAENIRKRIEAETMVTISVGYTTYRKKLTIDQFVKEADNAMYHSKQNGKNQVTAYRELRNPV